MDQEADTDPTHSPGPLVDRARVEVRTLDTNAAVYKIRTMGDLIDQTWGRDLIMARMSSVRAVVFPVVALQAEWIPWVR
jgi:hypothetical protein